MSRSHEWFFYCLHRWRVRPHEIKEKDGSFVGGDSHLERRWSAVGARASHTTQMKLFIAITTSAAAIQSDPGRISREDGIPAVLDCRCLPPQPCRPCVWPSSTMSSGWNFWRGSAAPCPERCQRPRRWATSWSRHWPLPHRSGLTEKPSRECSSPTTPWGRHHEGVEPISAVLYEPLLSALTEFVYSQVRAKWSRRLHSLKKGPRKSRDPLV